MISSSRATNEDWFADYTIGDNIWPLSNILFRIYSQVSLHSGQKVEAEVGWSVLMRQRKLHAQSVAQIRAISKMNPSEEDRLSKRGGYLSQADLAESYYWRGKIGVVLLDFRNAKRYLDQAMELCPVAGYDQKRYGDTNVGGV